MKEAEIVVSNCLIGALDPPTNTEGVVRSVMVMEKGDEKDGGFFASTVGVDCRPYAVIVHAGEDFVVRSIKTGGRQGRQLVNLSLPTYEAAESSNRKGARKEMCFCRCKHVTGSVLKGKRVVDGEAAIAGINSYHI